MKNKGREFEQECQRTINSGAFFNDADLSTNQYCIETKFTTKKSFRISTKILEKIWNQAFDLAKLPFLIIGIKDGSTQWILKINITKENKL